MSVLTFLEDLDKKRYAIKLHLNNVIFVFLEGQNIEVLVRKEKV
jgi:hypothetical protein